MCKCARYVAYQIEAGIMPNSPPLELRNLPRAPLTFPDHTPQIFSWPRPLRSLPGPPSPPEPGWQYLTHSARRVSAVARCGAYWVASPQNRM